MVLAFCWVLKVRQQQRRVALLGRFLSPYSIEKNIEMVTQGYLRALGEDDPARREQVWNLLRSNELELCRQVSQLASDFAMADAASTRVSKLPIWLPFAAGLAASFDMRKALRVHAQGICRAVEADATSGRDRAFVI